MRKPEKNTGDDSGADSQPAATPRDQDQLETRIRHSGTILRTKLRPPEMMPGLVARPRLTSLLQQNPQRPLTLVSAPAGYGKTTVVIQWLHATNTQPAWLQLDQRDNDLYNETSMNQES